MSDDPRHGVIACARVVSPPGVSDYPHTHYEKRACPICAELMYVGPRSAAKHAADGTPMCCMPCAVAGIYAAGGDPMRNVVTLGGP